MWLAALGLLLAAPPVAECDSGERCAALAFSLETSDPARSVALYERACTSLKHLKSCAQLALLKNDLALADRTCVAKEPLACAVQGLLLLDTKDESRALRLFASACEMGLLTACTSETTYEYEGPNQSFRFTKNRSAVPLSKPWRVFKTTVPDRRLIRFSPPRD